MKHAVKIDVDAARGRLWPADRLRGNHCGARVHFGAALAAARNPMECDFFERRIRAC